MMGDRDLRSAFDDHDYHDDPSLSLTRGPLALAPASLPVRHPALTGTPAPPRGPGPRPPQAAESLPLAVSLSLQL
eukprot:610846-Rhodomonas_salina.1